MYMLTHFFQNTSCAVVNAKKLIPFYNKKSWLIAGSLEIVSMEVKLIYTVEALLATTLVSNQL